LRKGWLFRGAPEFISKDLPVEARENEIILPNAPIDRLAMKKVIGVDLGLGKFI